MKIILIHGQSHKGISYHIGKYVAEKLTSKEQITEFFLPRDMPYFCSGCMQCMYKGFSACPHNDALLPITQAIHASDMLIFTTPVYCFRTTGSMKAFLDHYFTWWHSHTPQEDMYYKRAIIIGVGASVGMKKAISDIKVSLRFWGISKIQTLPIRGLSPSWESMEESIKEGILNKADKVIVKTKRQKASVSLTTKLIFMMCRKMQVANWNACPEDKEYWEKKGWLAKQRPWHPHE